MKIIINKIISGALAGGLAIWFLGSVVFAAAPTSVTIRATVVDNVSQAKKDGVQLELFKSGSTTGKLLTTSGGYANFSGVAVSKTDIYELRVGPNSNKEWKAVNLTLSPENTTKVCSPCLFSVPGAYSATTKNYDRYVKVGLGIVDSSQSTSVIVSGLVKDAKDGSIINGATVTGTDSVPPSVVTKDNNKYTLTFNNVQVGRSVSLTAVAAGYQDQPETIAVGSNDTINKDILMTKKGDDKKKLLPAPKPIIGIDSTNITVQVIEKGKGALGQHFFVFNAAVPDQSLTPGVEESILNYTVSGDAPWLTLVGGSSGTSIDALHRNKFDILFPTAKTLEVGEYTADIIVSDLKATNNPQKVTVSIKVTKPIVKMGEVLHSLIYGTIFDTKQFAENYCNRAKGTAPQEVKPKMAPPYGISIVGILDSLTINPEFHNSWQCVAIPESGKYKSTYQIKYKTAAVPSLITMAVENIKNNVSTGDKEIGSVQVTPSSALDKDGQPLVADVRFYVDVNLSGKENIDPHIQPIVSDYVKVRFNIFHKITLLPTAIEKVPTKTRGLFDKLGKVGKILDKKAAEILVDVFTKDKDKPIAQIAQKPTYANGYLILTRNQGLRNKYRSSATISETELRTLENEVNQAEDKIAYTNNAPIDTWVRANEPIYPFFIFDDLAPNTTDRRIISMLQGIEVISSEESSGVPVQTSVIRKIEPKTDANNNLVSIESYLPTPYSPGEQVVRREVNWIPNTGKQFTQEAK